MDNNLTKVLDQIDFSFRNICSVESDTFSNIQFQALDNSDLPELNFGASYLTSLPENVFVNLNTL